MSGGLMQLVAYGAQDVFLTGNPQITFFKVVYRRHTNFSMESIEQTFNGTADFGKKVNVTVSRNGDLITKTYIRCVLPDVTVVGDTTDPDADFYELTITETDDAGANPLALTIFSSELGQTFTRAALAAAIEIALDAGTNYARDYTVAENGTDIDISYVVVASSTSTILTASNINTTGALTIGSDTLLTGTPVSFASPASTTNILGAEASFEWIPEVGHFLIKEVEVEIGGQKIDKHYGTWLSVWAALTVPKGHEDGYATMIGNTSALTTATTVAAETNPAAPEADAIHAGVTLHIPLQFWFCRHTGLALPLIALQYHEVKFQIQFESFANLSIQSGPVIASPGMGDCSLYIDYIYLDTDERRRFAQVSHEYLIEQLQYTGDESLSGTNNKLKLNFNHPVKELLWIVQDDNRLSGNFTDVDGTKGELSPAGGVNPVSQAKLLLNGHDRFSQRDGRYFNTVQTYQHHTNTPREGINVYSFAMKPEEEQPSGSANMSRIDNAQLSVTLTAAGASANNPVAKVYATNYNILRITSGMGGLAYAN